MKKYSAKIKDLSSTRMNKKIKKQAWATSTQPAER